MNASFHTGNRKRLYEAMKPASLLVMFSGEDVRKTNDEYYPFYTDRDFYYLTGLDQHELVLMAVKEPSGNVHEQIYILPPDLMAERWTGARLKPTEVEALSGISDVRFVNQFQTDFHALAAGGHYSLTSGQIAQVYLDLFRVSPQDIDRPAHRLLKQIQANYPYLQVENANAILRRLRLIKQPCEIDAIRQAEKVTGEGIMAMMKASRPGMYEYQYKAEFDYALTQHGPQGPAFPSIISAGKNNFCIHYYSYRGQAHDGDMVLNDVGAVFRATGASRTSRSCCSTVRCKRRTTCSPLSSRASRWRRWMRRFAATTRRCSATRACWTSRKTSGAICGTAAHTMWATTCMMLSSVR